MNRKAFTLIELLAVILILGIISLIAVPTVNNVIKESKKGALKNTASNLARIAEQQCQIEKIHGENITSIYTIDDGISSKHIDTKNLPKNGMITIDNECNASVAVSDNGFCSIKDGDNLTVNSNLYNCEVDYTEIPATQESCFVFDKLTHTITGYRADDVSCPADISIPATINGITVEHIDDFAFVNGDYDEILTVGIKENFNNFILDLSDNVKYAGFDIFQIAMVKVDNKDLKKTCYTDYSYNGAIQKDYNYVLSQGDDFAFCNLDSDDGLSIVNNNKIITGVDFSKAINLISIGDGAFYNIGLEKITFGNLPNLTTLGTNIYSNNNISGIVDLSGLNNIEYIPRYMFTSNNISRLLLPKRVVNIYDFAFADNSIELLTLPDSIEFIGMGAFSSNVNLKVLKLGENLKEISYGAFANDDIISLLIPNSVLNIRDDAFSENENLSLLELGNNVESIGDYAFYNDNIGALIIPDSVLNIGEYAFYENENLTSLELGNKVESIGGYAFYNNNIGALIIPDSVKLLGEKIFDYNNISTLQIGKGLTEIPLETFGYNNIGNLVIPNNIKKIGVGAFGHSSIKTLTLGTGIKSISDWAFINNDIVSLTLPNSLIELGGGSFKDNQISNLVIGTGITTIFAQTFRNNNLTVLNIPSNINSISVGSFDGNKNLTIINIYKPLNSITNVNDWKGNATVNWLG